nr:ankyrin repeat-containing protein ITN1-like [Tanacetum cinerariifolium]
GDVENALENIELLGHGYEGDVIGESTPDALVNEFASLCNLQLTSGGVILKRVAMGGVSGGSVCGYRRRVVATGDWVAVAGRGGHVVVAGRDGDGCGMVGQRWWSDKIWWSEGITTLYSVVEKEHLQVVKELLKYSDKETLTRRSRLEFDPLHIAASEGYHARVELVINHDVSLCHTRSQGNTTPLVTAASKEHTTVVLELLSKIQAC